MERVMTVIFAPNTGPALESVDVKRDDTGQPLAVEAWQTGGASNLYLIAAPGGETLTTEQAAIKVNQGADILGVIPAGATLHRGLPPDVNTLIVFAEISVGAVQSQAATIRIHSDK